MMTTSIRTDLMPGIADKKKADIDALTEQVSSAEYEVEQMQAVVNAMTSKAAEFSAFLAAADADKDTALSNLNLVTDAVNKVKHLSESAKTALSQTVSAENNICATVSAVATLIKKLIFSVEVIDKLSALVNKQKALNPIIPDELVTLMAKATTDANNAVATTLTALTSCYAAESVLLEAKNITQLETNQADKLYDKMHLGYKSRGEILQESSFVFSLGRDATGIQALLQHRYHQAVNDYNAMLSENDVVTTQLEFAQSQLNNATIKLNSLKAGLAAEQAAAFAA